MNDLIPLYAAGKEKLSVTLGATEDLLHLHAGLLIFFVAALLFRRRMRSWVPVGLVWAFAIANEVIDAFSPTSAATRWETLLDIANTVVWPALLFLLGRGRGGAGAPWNSPGRPPILTVRRPAWPPRTMPSA